MAIAASSVTPTNSLEDFRIEFNNLVSDVTGITATNKFTENIIFEGATADAYETTLTVTDPTADRTVTLPNLTGTVSLITATETLTNKTLTSPAIGTSITHADDVKAYYGTGNDLEIFHDGSHSYVKDNGTGDLKLQASADVVIEDTSGADAAVFNVDAGQELYWRGGTSAGKKFETTQTGATVTGALDVTTDITGSTLNADGDTASGDNAAIGYTSAEGLILTGQGSTNDVTIKNDADGDVISIPTGTTNVTIAGDLTISGDDLYMGTNTSAYILVADGTNYNPVAVSGDVTISNAGAITIASTAVEGSMLNNNIISGLTALTSGLATTDEVLISDAGTIKRMDVSLIADLSAADATALAIALG